MAYVAEQREATGVVPDDRTLLVERFRDELGDWRIAVHSPFGAPVNAPWSLAIAARLRERYGLDAQALHSDDGIVLRLPETDEAPTAEQVLLDPDEVDALVQAEVATARCSPRGSGSARRGRCCCPAGTRASGRRCGSNVSGPPSC